MLLALLAASAFSHPNPQPPPELPAAVYCQRRKLEDVERQVQEARR